MISQNEKLVREQSVKDSHSTSSTKGTAIEVERLEEVHGAGSDHAIMR